MAGLAACRQRRRQRRPPQKLRALLSCQLEESSPLISGEGSRPRTEARRLSAAGRAKPRTVLVAAGLRGGSGPNVVEAVLELLGCHGSPARPIFFAGFDLAKRIVIVLPEAGVGEFALDPLICLV